MRRAMMLAIASLALAGCRPVGSQASRPQDTTHASARYDTVAPNITTTRALDSGIVTPREIALGDSVFNGRAGEGICATCHGRDGAGTRAAPSLSDQRWINGDGSIGFIKATVYQGVPRPKEHPLPMPPFGHTLTERQLQGVAAYVFSLSHRRGGR